MPQNTGSVLYNRNSKKKNKITDEIPRGISSLPSRNQYSNINCDNNFANSDLQQEPQKSENSTDDSVMENSPIIGTESDSLDQNLVSNSRFIEQFQPPTSFSSSRVNVR